MGKQSAMPCMFISVVLALVLGSQVFADVVYVDNISDLLANIGEDNVEVVMATISTDLGSGGRYIVPACPAGVPEASDTTCGQMQQGDNSVLRSHLDLEQDVRGVPTGVELTAGAVIDCSALPSSGQLACLVGGDGSTIRNLTIQPPLRNGIMIVPGKKVTIEGVVVRESFRGIFFTTESGRETRGKVRHSLVEDTVLAGIFVLVGSADFLSPSNESELNVVLEANRLTDIGVHPILYTWAFGGSGNKSHVEMTDNVVGPSNRFGISILSRDSFVGDPVQDNEASFKIKGGHLASDTGIFMLNFTRGGTGDDNSNNLVMGEVNGVTFENTSIPAVRAVYQPGWGTGNLALLEMKNNVYLGVESGLLLNPQEDSGNDWQLEDSEAKFQLKNTNFDTFDVSDDFEK